MGDALDLDLAALEPAPTKMVANLPYGVAATVILRTVAELPSIQSWVVMVQREVGERFAAKPGTDAYGVPSVLAQLECDVKVLRPVSRQVFRPVPNVDSVLLGLSRRAGQRASPTEIRLVHDAFRHRRKALAGSLAAVASRGCASGRGRRWSRWACRPMCGLRRLAPQQFVELAGKTVRDEVAGAGAGQGQPVAVPGRHARGRPAPAGRPCSSRCRWQTRSSSR